MAIDITAAALLALLELAVSTTTVKEAPVLLLMTKVPGLLKVTLAAPLPATIKSMPAFAASPESKSRSSAL